jgi:D-inositol-3-phosphate glycosyltransferase
MGLFRGRIQARASSPLNFFNIHYSCATISRFLAVVDQNEREALSSALNDVRENRFSIISPRQLVATASQRRAVLHALNGDLTRGLFIRAYAGVPNWPVVGITHDLSDPTAYSQLILAFCGGIQSNDAIVCSSHAAARAIRQQAANICEMMRIDNLNLRLPILPYGIDVRSLPRYQKANVRQKLSLSSNDFVFTYVGRICSLTKADLIGLVNCFLDAFPSRRDVKLVIAGSVLGPDEENYTQEILKLTSVRGGAERIAVVRNPDSQLKGELYSIADVFVSPANSLQESFGVTLLEAMAYGLPVVASDWNGYRDIVLHGKTGFLFGSKVSSKDASLLHLDSAFDSRKPFLKRIQENVLLNWAECAQFLVLLEQNRRLAESLGHAGKRRVSERFTWDTVLKQHSHCWLELLNATPDPGYFSSAKSLYLDPINAFVGHASAEYSGSTE